MPEGDSLRRAADRVRVLEGQVVSVETPHPRAALLGLADWLDGRRLERVEAVGKNLLLTFEGGVVLRSHLRMKGRWHVRRAEEKLTGRPWLVLRGEEWKAVQWNGPVLELGSGAPLPVRRLGPDIMDAPPDLDAMVERLRATDQRRRSERRSWISGSSPGSGTCGRPRPSGWRGVPRGCPFARSRTPSSGASSRLQPRQCRPLGPGGRSTVGSAGRAGGVARRSAPGPRAKRREWRTGVRRARQERG